MSKTKRMTMDDVVSLAQARTKLANVDEEIALARKRLAALRSGRPPAPSTLYRAQAFLTGANAGLAEATVTAEQIEAAESVVGVLEKAREMQVEVCERERIEAVDLVVQSRRGEYAELVADALAQSEAAVVALGHVADFIPNLRRELKAKSATEVKLRSVVPNLRIMGLLRGGLIPQLKQAAEYFLR